jgi:hypothetical protein
MIGKAGGLAWAVMAIYIICSSTLPGRGKGCLRR